MGVTLMKPNELMAGDWVICHHPTCEPKQIQVNVGLLHVLEQQDLGFQTEESPLFRIVEPIPLTTETLEKNGFEFDGEIYKLGDYQLVIEYRGGFLFGWVFCHRKQLKYVHELQHVLRLCEIDKDIVL